MNAFDLLHSPLDGSNLIEASAGTGKTHTIVGIFLRLIVEYNLAPQDILVVTYTVAATEELRERIRHTLKNANEAFFRGESADPFLHGLLQKARQEKQYEEKQRLLKTALKNIEEASILTIHSFCLRMLQEYALESGTSFAAELLPGEEAIRRSFAQDFWRRHFYHGAPCLVSYALEENISPFTYEGLLQKIPFTATLTLIPAVSPPDEKETEEEAGRLASLFASLRQSWFQERDCLEELLCHADLNRRIYGTKITSVFRQLDIFFAGEALSFPPIPELAKMSSSVLEKNTHKGHATPDHTFFHDVDNFLTAAGKLQRLLDLHLLFLKREMITTAKGELSAQKEQKNLLSYDDLLQRLQRALTENGNLAGKIRNRFKAVLIDEFQDTDTVQYAIFHHLFLRGDKSRRPFFAIGDPKQAIYAFRGADIFAYLQARRSMRHIYTLTENWRSEPELINAINVLFGLARKPFIYDGIDYHSISAARKPEREYLTIDGAKEAPFQFWVSPEDDDEHGSENADYPNDAAKNHRQNISLETRIARAVAAEISRLIRLGRENRAMAGTRPLQPQDIAVLVRTNRETGIISNALSQVNIPHAVSSQENVFHSSAAEDLQHILLVLANPHNQPMLRRALATTLMARNGSDIASLSADDEEAIRQRFYGYHTLWLNDGFIRMFRSFLAEEKVYSGILALRQGERHLTNILHLGELLHQAAAGGHLSMHELMDWLNERIKSGETLPEEYELRLERDEKAVRVVTIHKSKGLEYPVVFCPFSWKAGRQEKNPPYVLYHDPEQEFRLVLDLGSERFDEHCRFFRQESLAEEVRLLYVALTRAKHRIYYVGCRNKNSHFSAAAYLWQQTPEMDETNLIDEAQNRHKLFMDEDFLRDLEKIRDISPQAIAIADLPETEPAYLPHPRCGSILSCRPFKRLIRTNWRVTSYSALTTHNRPTSGEIPWDDMPELAEEERTEKNLPAKKTDFASPFSFPGGTRAGLFLHDIFRFIDYQHHEEEKSQLVMEKTLRQYNYDDNWLPMIKNMAKDVTSAL
ncbi:MAG: exodeoxyribonuclease V subunit beta, partial [Syntrophobacterales bacterium]|nr:exodeoxyribonuclease V subunit beta [Syntrophobacterales bacterium]